VYYVVEFFAVTSCMPAVIIVVITTDQSRTLDYFLDTISLYISSTPSIVQRIPEYMMLTKSELTRPRPRSRPRSRTFKAKDAFLLASSAEKCWSISQLRLKIWFMC